ncbi:hypothetical protein [Rhodococcus triatomae]
MKHRSSVAPVGERVRIQINGPDDSTVDATGKVVADYSDEIGNTGTDVGRDWARPHRYAIALDDGCLVFTDTITSID